MTCFDHRAGPPAQSDPELFAAIEAEASATAHLVADVPDDPGNPATIGRVREQVAALTRRFPVYRRRCPAA